jgi:hypothetical protein
MKIRIGTKKIVMVKHHRILVLVIDERMNWNKHIQDAKKSAGKILNLTKCLSHTSWRANQKIHQVILLSTLRYSETAYGTVSKAVLRKLDPIHHRGVRLALGTFAVCKTESELCEAESPTLTEMRDENTMKTGIRILTNENHPIRSKMINRNIYDDYAMKPIPAAELLRQMDIDGRKVEKTPAMVHRRWVKYGLVSL